MFSTTFLFFVAFQLFSTAAVLRGRGQLYLLAARSRLGVLAIGLVRVANKTL